MHFKSVFLIVCLNKRFKQLLVFTKFVQSFIGFGFTAILWPPLGILQLDLKKEP